ncbi:MAG: hypothetical protein F6J86_19365 [Symploca sp. SIO1B1]|nr:hypothetical protein [Symploca sp. SIO1B1]
MNIYFLVEGKSSEKKIYPKWLEYLIPQLNKVQYYDQVEENNYFLISGKGYPKTISHGIPNAIDKITEVGKYDYLVICVDADEETIDARKKYIYDFIQENDIELGKTKLVLIIQNRCIETWLLGNRKMFNSKQPQEEPLSSYVNYYDVSQDDPELMGDYDGSNHAKFHGSYLKEVFKAKNLSYTKKFPGEAQKEHYLDQLLKRIDEKSEHLQTFQSFIQFCEMINRKINT